MENQKVRLHINRPSSTRIKYRLKLSYGKEFSFWHRSRRSAVVHALKILENSRGTKFVEVYRILTAMYYDPVIELVCRIKNI